MSYIHCPVTVQLRYCSWFILNYTLCERLQFELNGIDVGYFRTTHQDGFFPIEGLNIESKTVCFSIVLVQTDDL